jgi:predicted secreted protein
MLFVVEPRGNRTASASCFERGAGKRVSGLPLRSAGCIVGLTFAIATSGSGSAQVPEQPVVALSASASMSVPNDRLQAWLRAEAESTSAATAAAQVNTRIAKALAEAKQYPAVKTASAGYSTQQITEVGKAARWRVTQTVSLESNDFTAAATLISKLQDEGGLLLSGMGFSLAESSRRSAEDALTQQAVKSWQARAQQASQAFGFAGWRTGRVTVQTGDGSRPYPVMRAQVAGSMGAAPVALEAGTTEVSVTVSGDALLEQAKPQPR